jgi:hypothetical protein
MLRAVSADTADAAASSTAFTRAHPDCVPVTADLMAGTEKWGLTSCAWLSQAASQASVTMAETGSETKFLRDT